MLFLAMLVMYAGIATAQVTQVSGQVIDAEDGSPLTGATVSVAGTNLATATDLDGNFTLKGLKPAHQKITVSYIGYEKQTLPAQSKMKIAMKAANTTMDEVIVVAFGKQKREAFTGSATVIKSEEITRQQVTNPVEALNGKVAGLQMTEDNSLSVGSSPSMLVRGISSLNASNEPLIVVDGMPFGGYLNDLNPADIESMTVLKDAASNALYGARGANGVIMITTKKAERGNTRVTFDAKWGVNTDGHVEYDIIDNPGEYYEAYYRALTNYYMYRQENPMGFDQAHITANKTIPMPDSQGGLGYMVYNVPQGEFLIGTNGKLNPHATLGNRVAYNNQIYTLYPDNWLKEGTRNGLRQEYNFSLTGGNDKYSLMATLGYLNNEGLSNNNDIKRYTSRVKVNYQAYDFMRVGANAGYTHTVSNTLGAVFGTPFNIAPIYPLYVRDGNGNILTDRNGKRYDYGNNDMGFMRPADPQGNVNQDDNLNINEVDANAFNISGFGTIDFLRDFHLTVNGSVYITESRSKSTYNPYYGYNATSGGMTSLDHYRTTDYNFQQLLNYNRSFGAHNVDLLLGHEYSRTEGMDLYANASKFADYNQNSEISGTIINGTMGSSTSLYNVEGFFGRGQYDYDNRYFFSGSYRRDGSSRFDPSHRWGSFWSLGAAWIITKEDWMPKSHILNMLKLKVSYGEQGNDGIGDFMYADLYAIGNNNNNVALTFSSKGTKDITWETVGNFNTGLEFELFNSRLTGSVDYYYRKTSDMLMWFSAPVEIGYSGYYDNVGDMSNRGVELNLNGDIIKTRNFGWSMGMNMAWQVNRIEYIPKAKRGYTLEGYEGYVSGDFFDAERLPMYSFRLKRYAGVNEKGEALYYRRAKEGGLETTTRLDQADYFLCGTALPTLFGGFNTSFKIYGVDINAQFTYSLGGKKLDVGYRALIGAPTGVATGLGLHRDVMKAWQPGDPATTEAISPLYCYNDVNGNALTDRFLVSANQLTLKNISVGYNFPKNMIQKLKMNQLRVFAVCENVGYWTARRGFDPRGSISQGTYGGWPAMRTISGGVTVQF